MKFKSIKYKILFWFIGIIFTVLIVFSFLLYILLENVIHGDIKFQMENKAQFIKENIVTDFDKDKVKLYAKLLNIEFVILKNKDIVYASKSFPLENIEIYKESENNFFIQKTKDKTEDAILRTQITTPYKAEMILYQKEINNIAEDIQEILLYLNPLLLLFLIFVGNNLIDKILIPIKKLTQTVKNINISDMPNKINSSKENNEINQLISAFNEMVERLRNGIETLNSFNYDVSHELKTPLTVVNAQVELCLVKNRDIDYYEKSMHTIQYEMQQIQKIIEELLLFTQYSKETVQKTFEKINLDAILIDVISKYEKQANEKQLHININKIENIKIEANPLLINIIFSNLLDNAIKYTPKNKQISIELGYKNQKGYFQIEDQGVGIKQEYLHKITDKFYRIDQSRNKKIEGFGLGLSLVKNFVILHDAKMDIQSTYKKGTIVCIDF